MEEENKIKSAKKGYIIAIFLLLLIIGALTFYVFYGNKLLKSDVETKIVDQKECPEQNECNCPNDTQKDDTSTDLVIYNDKYLGNDEVYKVSLRYIKDSETAVLIINAKEYLKNVVNYYIVSKGGDMANGEEYIVFLLSDGTISSLYIDNMEVTGEIKINSNIGNLKNVVNVYSSLKSCNANEPCLYNIYAQTKDGKTTELFKEG